MLGLTVENGLHMDAPKRGSPPDVSTPGGRIKQARLNAKLTQKELGRRIGISQPVITEWEAGGAEPNLPQYRSIAEVTGHDLIWLLIGRDPNDSNSFAGIAAAAQKQNRHFAWALVETARMFVEEGVDAKFLVILGYVQKFLAAAENSPDEPGSKKAISREIETERAKLRKNVDEAIQKGL